MRHGLRIRSELGVFAPASPPLLHHANMDTPQVEVPGPDNPDSNAQNAAPNPNPTANANPNPGTEVEMGGTQEAVNATEPATEDTTLPDAQPEPEPPTPAKKNPFNFLE